MRSGSHVVCFRPRPLAIGRTQLGLSAVPHFLLLCFSPFSPLSFVSRYLFYTFSFILFFFSQHTPVAQHTSTHPHTHLPIHTHTFGSAASQLTFILAEMQSGSQARVHNGLLIQDSGGGCTKLQERRRQEERMRKKKEREKVEIQK